MIPSPHRGAGPALHEQAHVTTDISWEEAQRLYPVGSLARGVVKLRLPFGVFLDLDEAPGISAFIDLLSYNPDGTINDPAAPPVPLPEVGERVEGVVGQHGDRQIKIRVGLPYWETRAPRSLSDGGTNAP